MPHNLFNSIHDEYKHLGILLNKLHENSIGSYRRSISNHLWDIRWQHHDMHVKKMERFCNSVKRIVLGMREKNLIYFLHDQILISIDLIIAGLEKVVELYKAHSGAHGDVNLRTLDVKIYL